MLEWLKNSIPLYSMWLLQHGTDTVQGRACSNATTVVPQYISQVRIK